jgi:glycosyltransferase involved in cell wall biosynthesis
MRERPTVHIFNCVDTAVFRPMDQRAAREALGLPLNGRVICFGADAVRSHRKGFELLEKTLATLNRDDVTLAVFGAGEDVDVADIPTRWLGVLSDEEKVAQMYAAADLLAVPSRQDNLPNTCVEALACGTPVVGFRVGGMSELVAQDREGYLAVPFDVADLAHGIECVLKDEAHLAELGANARAKAEKYFAPNVVAEQYGALYQRVLGG